MAAARTPLVKILKPTNYEKELIRKILENEITCSICLDTYSRPRGLNCKHVFCQTCLLDWMRDRNTCPICRNRISHETVKCEWLESIIEDLKEENISSSTNNQSFHRRPSSLSKNTSSVNRQNGGKNCQRPPWRC